MENMADLYTIAAIVAFSASAVFALLALFFMIKFRVFKIIGDLSGRTAKKSIAQMRAENEKSGKKLHRPTHAAESRGPITKAIERSVSQPALSNGGATDVLIRDGNVMAGAGAATEVLERPQDGETELLGQETEVLDRSTQHTAPQRPVQQGRQPERFVFVQNIELVSTDESI